MSLTNTDAIRYFTIGETAVITVKVNKPSTRQPIDPTSVTMSRLTLDGLAQPIGGYVFERQSEGVYKLSIDTTDMAAGAYGVRSVIEGVLGRVIVEDSFVLGG